MERNVTHVYAISQQMSYICKYNLIFYTAMHFLILVFSVLGNFRYNVCKEITSSMWHKLQAQKSRLCAEEEKAVCQG